MAETDLLVRADSVCSLVAYRYSRGLPPDVRDELIAVSRAIRAHLWDARAARPS